MRQYKVEVNKTLVDNVALDYNLFIHEKWQVEVITTPSLSSMTERKAQSDMVEMILQFMINFGFEKVKINKL